MDIKNQWIGKICLALGVLILPSLSFGTEMENVYYVGEEVQLSKSIKSIKNANPGKETITAQVGSDYLNGYRDAGGFQEGQLKHVDNLIIFLDENPGQYTEVELINSRTNTTGDGKIEIFTPPYNK